MCENVESARQILEVALAEHPCRGSITAALTANPHTVSSEIEMVRLWGITHGERWDGLVDAEYGLRGGSAADRRLIAEGLALLEVAGTFQRWLTLTRSAHQTAEVL